MLSLSTVSLGSERLHSGLHAERSHLHLSVSNLCLAVQEQGQELLNLLEAVAARNAFPHQHSATSPAAPTPQTASTAASTTASSSAAPTASNPPAKAPVPLSTSASPGGKKRASASAAAPPLHLRVAGDAASQAEPNPGSTTKAKFDFPKVGLMHLVTQMAQTLMLKCLLPCLSPDHDFGQKMYAPWMQLLVLGVEDLIESTEDKALAPNLQPHFELAGEIRFFCCLSCMPCQAWINPACFSQREHLAELRMHCVLLLSI